MHTNHIQTEKVARPGRASVAGRLAGAAVAGALILGAPVLAAVTAAPASADIVLPFLHEDGGIGVTERGIIVVHENGDGMSIKRDGIDWEYGGFEFEFGRP